MPANVREPTRRVHAKGKIEMQGSNLGTELATQSPHLTLRCYSHFYANSAIDPLLPTVNFYLSGRAHVISNQTRHKIHKSVTYTGGRRYNKLVRLKPAGGNGGTKGGLTACPRNIRRVRELTGQEVPLAPH
jgi:hypothetical protein